LIRDATEETLDEEQRPNKQLRSLQILCCADLVDRLALQQEMAAATIMVYLRTRTEKACLAVHCRITALIFRASYA